jgi:hypothetical protein
VGSRRQSRRSNGELSDWAGVRGGQENLCRTKERSDRGTDSSRAGSGERTGVVDLRQWSGPADRRLTLPVPCKLNFDSDIALADKLDDGLLLATDPNLKDFFAHSGKLILYHGWTDPLVAPRNTVDYYKSVFRSNDAGAESSVRLFMAPGDGSLRRGRGAISL